MNRHPFPNLLVFLPVLILSIADANDAAMNDGSEGPEPIGWRSGTESIIQMQSEHLRIHFGVEMTQVHAAFTFLSHKTSGPARQKLGFPIASRSDLDGDVIGPIENLVTRVNGEVIESELVEGFYEQIVKPDGSVFYEKHDKAPDPENPGLVRKHAWYVIEVEFPVGKPVVVEREYSCPTGADTSMNAFFIYETRTGGAWKGAIEKLTAEVTFDETVRTDLVFFSPESGWSWNRDRTLATLVWETFEPRLEDDRTYFEVSTLHIKRIEELHREYPEDFPPLERWIAIRRGEEP
ncbi:MAG: hypothetical protein AAGC68_01595 [Verrucomicrobiota bacterium]